VKSPEYYKGKEQTYLKHFFLEKYLETVGFHIGYAQSEFVYVDCFSGPWRHEHEDLVDTSIRISLDKLDYVRNVLMARQKYPTIRAIFIEKDPIAFAALQQALGQYQCGVKTIPLPGTFEDNILRILKEVGKAFAFCFVDPTGWTGLAMDRLQPLLRHQPGEVVINFMYDFINRFLNSQDPAIEASLDRFFGTNAWRNLRNRPDREAAIINFYAERVRTTGNFTYVASTKILKPLQQRAYFHLIYATRSPKGIEKFREVEKRLVTEQEQVRETAQREHREQRTGQEELSFGDPATLSLAVQNEREVQRENARARLFELLKRGPRRYEEVLAILLQLPLFWKTDLNDVLVEERRAKRIVIEGMTPRQRVPKEGSIIRLADPA
jgi:three-Cys-motif partner protein